jgi:hypothetical protein
MKVAKIIQRQEVDSEIHVTVNIRDEDGSNNYVLVEDKEQFERGGIYYEGKPELLLQDSGRCGLFFLLHLSPPSPSSLFFLSPPPTPISPPSPL